ncbi:hypothetical protein [Streptomyces sp. NPDC005017]|uniref:hypothetical protein n=1 Tax=Streptomyces sp. NPDC005017 TaxID=3364706 RepID=UPI0036B80D0E
MTTRSGLSALQEALRALERSGRAARRSCGLPDSRSEAAREVGKDGQGGRLDARRISSWLDPEQGRAPRDADQVWALVRVWARWAGDRTQRRVYWNKLVEDAQPIKGEPAARSAGSPWLGRVVGTLRDEDALGLEVHPAIEGGTGPLPPYLPRPHDQALRDELRAADEHGGLVVLVGGSSFGKTRACWEAVRELLPDWRLWHPLTPTRSEALIAALADERLGPRTVVWLNDAWQYLGIDAGGERAASAMHARLQRRVDAPVLILGSM